MEKKQEQARPWTENRLRDGVPEICKGCGNYLPMFFKVIEKECAVFTTCEGVRNNACGAWTRPIKTPAF